MKQCDFVHYQSVGERWTWRCSVCGFVTKAAATQPRRHCRHAQAKQERALVPYLTCHHRRQAIATTDGQTSGCGCSSTPVDVYHCRHFNEPVLKQAAARCKDKIAAKVPGYTGRTCRECKVPMGDAPVDIIHATQKPSWQIMRERGEAVLRAAGLALHCEEAVTPKPDALERTVRERSP